MTKDYRNAIRGLCGNYDKQANNDFLIPKNCILQKPEEFSATFALLGNETEDSNVQKTIARNKEKANRATCTPLTPRQTDVISEREAGRALEKRTWGYHQNRNQNKKKPQENVRVIYRIKVDESDQEICFSHVSLPACPENTKPVELMKKNVSMYCMPRINAARKLKYQILQGANPDLSHKSVSFEQAFEVPIACQATSID